MKMITLARPMTVHDELRHPIEGSLPVSDAEAQRLELAGALSEEPRDIDDHEEPEGDGLDAMTVAELHVLVTKEGVALNDATKKADIIAAIRKHRDEQAG